MSQELTKIKDRFRIDSLIAHGGMATVYKGTDLTLARTVAVKVLSEDLAKDQSFLLRFRREAQAAAALTHPNIVAVYDTGAEAGLHYIVMEYVEGRSLQDILEEEGTLTPERAATIGSDIARALAAAHAKGIVHRDIKPGNIMVSDYGFVKVTDFGIAKAATAGALTQVGAILGTVAYLSPEQARGEEVDPRSDIYSLGALVYQMLTGRPPFNAETLMEMVNKLNNQAPTRPSILNPDVPPSLEEVVMKALAKDPDRRQQTADDLADQLVQSLKGDPLPTAAYVTPMAGAATVDEGPDRTLVAPAGLIEEEVLADESRTEVIAAPVVRDRRRPPFPTRAVVGGLIALAVLILGALLLSNLNGPTAPVTDLSPTPTADLGVTVAPRPRQQATTAAPPPPTAATVPTTLPPEPVTEPPAPITEPPVVITQPPATQPPENPGNATGRDGNPGADASGAGSDDEETDVAVDEDLLGGVPNA